MSLYLRTGFGHHNMTDKKFFSKEDTLFFKGIGILLIAVHNYFHLFPGFSIQNESSFSRKNLLSFLEYMSSFDFNQIFAGSFSFLGHYGVQIFIFFSAYGLAIQFGKGIRTDKEFIFYRLKKIYFLLAFGFVCAMGIYALFGAEFSVKNTVIKFFLLTSTVSGFSGAQMYQMLSGPFWFFAVIIQLYVCFPFLYRLIGRFNLKNSWTLFLGSYIIIYALHFLNIGEDWIVSGYEIGGITPWGNLIGHLPEAILGIVMAQNGIIRFKPIVWISALVIFFGSQCIEALFPLSFLMITILLIQSIYFIDVSVRGSLRKAILFTGTISMVLFLINAPIREFQFLSREFGLESGVLKFPVFILLLYLMGYLLFLLYDFLRKKAKL